MKRHVNLLIFILVTAAIITTAYLPRFTRNEKTRVRQAVQFVISNHPFASILPPPNSDRLERPISMLFLGDIMLGRYVRTLMEKNKNLDYPFEKLTPFLQARAFDAVIANLEGPIIDKPVRSQTGMTFGFAPDTAEIIKRNSIDIVTIANNHTLDQGKKGLESTKKYLDTAGVLYFGHPIMPDRNDVLIQEYAAHTTSSAAPDSPLTIAFIGFHDATRKLDLPAAIQLIKEIDPTVDAVVVVIHWGIEYQQKPSKRQQELAHAFIDAGADLIIGHHPHIVQTDETYRGVPIIYSLGNLIFDQYFRADTQEGLAVEVQWQPNTATATTADPTKRFTPVIIKHPYKLPKSQPIFDD